jgi:hypothetical protein
MTILASQLGARVRCSVVLLAGRDAARLDAYLSWLGAKDFSPDYEFILVSDGQLPVGDAASQCLPAGLRIVDASGPLSEQQKFDSGAAAACGRFLLFVRNLMPFDPAVLEESLSELVRSPTPVSCSSSQVFVLVNAAFYRRMGGFQAIVGGLTPTQTPAGGGAAGSTASSAGAASQQEARPACQKPADRQWETAYARLREPKRRGGVPSAESAADQIVCDLKGSGFRVADLTVDVADYRRYVERAQLYRREEFYGGLDGPNFPEKSLEHYVAANLLELGPADTYIDVASQDSPAPLVYRHLFACKTYRQDLSVPPGVHGDTIGSDAASIPVPDGFATKMGLHCSFEHFEGDCDTRFVREASRILRPGGRVCIAPLYLCSHYAIQTDPAVLSAGSVEFDPQAVLYCKKGYRNRHGRYYDAPHLARRVAAALGALDLQIYCVTNPREVHPSCYLKFVALLTKPTSNPSGHALLSGSRQETPQVAFVPGTGSAGTCDVGLLRNRPDTPQPHAFR